MDKLLFKGQDILSNQKDITYDFESMSDIGNGKNLVVKLIGRNIDSTYKEYAIKYFDKPHLVQIESAILDLLSNSNYSLRKVGENTNQEPYFHVTEFLDEYKFPENNSKIIWESIIKKIVKLHLAYHNSLTSLFDQKPIVKLLSKGQGFLNNKKLLINNVHILLEMKNEKQQLLIDKYSQDGVGIDLMISYLSKELASCKHISLLHGDLHRWNILYKKENSGIDVRFIDWEFAGYGVSQLDLGHLFYDEIDNWVTNKITNGIFVGDFSRELIKMYWDIYTVEKEYCWDDFIRVQRICNCYRALCLSFVLNNYPDEKYFAVDMLNISYNIFLKKIIGE